MKTKILIVEHNKTDIELLEYELTKGGISYEAEIVENEKDYGKALKVFLPDIILSDYSLPFFDGNTAFNMREAIAPATPFIFVSGSIGEENSVAFIKRGVTDYALKDKLFTLAPKVSRALQESKEKRNKARTDLEQKESESRLKEAQMIAHIGNWDIDLLTQTHHWSDELFTIFGLAKDELIPSMELFTSFIHGSDKKYVKKIIDETTAAVSSSTFEFRFVTKGGLERYGLANSRFELDKDKRPIRLFGIIQDVTDKKLAADKLKKANRLYAFISQVNQSIVHIKEEGALFSKCCRIALEFGKFKIAWIGMFDGPRTSISLVDQAGLKKSDLKLFANAPIEKNGPQDFVLNWSSYYFSNDILASDGLENWMPFARAEGINAVMVLPIKKGGVTIGTFNLYASEKNFFDVEEIALLVEVTSDISFAMDVFEKQRKHHQTEVLLVKSEKQFRHTLDNMLEGIQIHDFNWRYVYVNESLAKYSQSTKEELVGVTLMEKFPGIEQTELFKTMQQCMLERTPKHLETEFVFPDGSKSYFELSIQPIPEGIFILSMDRSEQIKASTKALKVSRLYAFISAINQSIVHINDEQELLSHACRIATDIGQFKMAWIDLLNDPEPQVIADGTQVLGPCSKPFNPALRSLLTDEVISTGLYAVRNNMQTDPLMSSWKSTLEENGINASISLPIKKFGKTIGIFGFHSAVENFFDGEEIALLLELTGDISFALDVFETRKKHAKAEKLLIERDKQLEFDRNNMKALLNNTKDMMWSVDRDFKLITSNQTFDEMVQHMSGSPAKKGSEILMSGFSDEQLVRYRGYYERAFSGESFTELEYSEQPWDIWSQISYYPIYKGSEVIGTACFSHDITDQKKAEDHLRLLESVITNITDSVLITEAVPLNLPGPKIIFVNRAFTEMTGYKPEEVIGKTPRLLQGPKTDRNKLDVLRDALEKQQSVEVEIVNYKKNGEEFWNNFAIVPLVDKDGQYTHSVSVQRDATPRRELEETTRKQLELLVVERTHDLNEALKTEKDLVEMKNRFVSIASHEFRTPLSTISFAAESIRNYFHQLQPEEINRKLIKIEDQASHMTNLLEDILTLGKSDAGKIKVKRISLDLKDFIDSLIEEVRSTVKDTRKIDFVFSCANKMVSADDKLLRNVITNLLTNALKFSTATSTITIVATDHNEGILIEVTDEGIGIAEDELASIFESFHRGSNVSTVQGTGLGLSILKKAVELMNGTIHVKSRLNQGSTFSVQIPLK